MGGARGNRGGAALDERVNSACPRMGGGGAVGGALRPVDNLWASPRGGPRGPGLGDCIPHGGAWATLRARDENRETRPQRPGEVEFEALRTTRSELGIALPPASRSHAFSLRRETGTEPERTADVDNRGRRAARAEPAEPFEVASERQDAAQRIHFNRVESKPGVNGHHGQKTRTARPVISPRGT